MQRHVTAQPIGTYTQPAITKPLSATSARVTYVRCLRNGPSVADVCPERLGWRYRTLDAGHWPMITNPAETAQVIIELAAS